MKRRLFDIFLCALSIFCSQAAQESLFDGRTFTGWEGETNSVWRLRDGAIVGGSLNGNPRNEFLATLRRFDNFHLRLEYKLVGTEGFINGGVQFRSERIANPSNEMSGFQADIGAGCSGSLYDESRRKRMLVSAETNLVARLEKPGDWNRYEIIARGPEIQIFLNGVRTAVWVEQEKNIAPEGLIALQIHGNNKAEISYRNISIEPLEKPLVPPEADVLRRFGEGQPSVPLPPFVAGKFSVADKDVIIFVGQENFVRDQKAGEIESILALQYSGQKPRFRSMAYEADTVYEQWRDLNFGSWTRQLETAEATIVICQFGQMEALDGQGRLTEFTAAYHRLLDQFAARTRKLVLVSPMPFEKPLPPQTPDLTLRNEDVLAYAAAVREVARQRAAVFVDLTVPGRAKLSPRWTDDGIHLNPEGLREVARIIAAQLGAKEQSLAGNPALREAIAEKNRVWYDAWRPANWSFVYGDRISQPFGKSGGLEPSLKEEFERHRPLVAAADARIHAMARGETAPPAVLPSTGSTPLVETKALSPEEELATFTAAEGYEVNLFASERDGVVKPTQFSWDEKGRLYIACSPTYPQSRASAKPADYILVLEDANGDGKAEKSWKFAEGLTMVQGVELGEGGVFACDFDQIVHFRDTDGDGRADQRRVYLSGFGIGDTHQLVNSITHGPDGSLWFTQGLHAFSRVETPWGISRLDRAAVWRLRPRQLRLEGFFGGGMAGANCWGVAFDDYGQVFHKSGDRPQGYWTVPGMVRGASPTGSSSTTDANVSYANSPEQYHSVGPLFDTSPKTTALEIIGTRALPDDIQGCAVIGGYFGAVVELHRFADAGSGFKTTQLPKLLKSSSTSFRPVDVTVGPDGAIYVADWFNPVIGHYQASYADPNRDKTHGRIWRITAKGRAPVKQPDLARMSAPELLEQLRSPERWTRYQAKRLLFDMPTVEVVKAADAFAAKLEPVTANLERVLLDLTGVFEAHETPRPDLLSRLSAARDPRVRAYAARVTGAWGEKLPDALKRLASSVRDANPRVRLEAVVAASYVPQPEAVQIVAAAVDLPRDPFLDYAIRQSARALQPRWAAPFTSNQLAFSTATQSDYFRVLLGSHPKPLSPGQEIYEMACLPCHQPEGKGLPGVYPPLAGSHLVQGDRATLVKILLHGLSGPITVAGQNFGGLDSVPMPAMGGLTDQQIADVLTYVRQDFGSNAGVVSADDVKRIRATTSRRAAPWTAAELGNP